MPSKRQTPFATLTYHKKSENVADWLAGRYLLRRLADTVIISCYDDIINSFDSKKDIISTLIRAATTQQIKHIVKILKDAQLKEIERNNHKIVDKYAKDENINKTYFNYLSTDSIFNICEFLQRKDIDQFKRTSTPNALIAFEVMKSYKMGMFNMTELIRQNDYKYPIELDIKSKIKTNRVKPFTKYHSLMQLYSIRYNIPLQNMLILQATKMHSSIYQATILDDNKEFLHRKVEKNKVFYILDQSKIIKLNNTKKAQTMNELNVHCNKGHTITLLQYFDRHQQRIQNVQFLCLDATTTLSRFESYILNDLLSVYAALYPHSSTSWCHQLLCTANKMKQSGSNLHESLIKIYHNIGTHGIRFDAYKPWPCTQLQSSSKPNDFQVITFELNPVFILSTSGNEQPFYANVKQYYTDKKATYQLTVTNNISQNELKQQCIYCMRKKRKVKEAAPEPIDINTCLKKEEQLKNEQVRLRRIKHPKTRKKHKQIACIRCWKAMTRCSVNRPCDRCVRIGYTDCVDRPSSSRRRRGRHLYHSDIDKAVRVKLSVTPLTTVKMIQNKISQHFNKTIPANNIQLFSEIKSNSNTVQRKYLWHNAYETIGNINCDRCCRWEIVPYDTLSNVHYDMFQISVYQNTQKRAFLGAKPVLFNFPNAPVFEVYIRVYGNSAYDEKQSENDETFKVNELMASLKYFAAHPLDGNKYQRITDKFAAKDAYSFVIMDKKDISNKRFKCYDMENIYAAVFDKNVRLCNVNVLIVRNDKQLLNGMDDLQSVCISIIVRLGKVQNIICSTDHCSDIGYPKKIWITKKVTLKEMMDKCLEINAAEYEFDSCLSNNGSMQENDNIYQKMQDCQESNELLILLKEVNYLELQI